MALGRTHDRFNLYMGTLCSSGLWVYFQTPLKALLSFFLGWLFSTYCFGPDSDLGHKKRLGPFNMIFAPYAWFHRHRGLSHIPVLGTLSRLFYLVFFFVVSYLIFYMIKDGSFRIFSVQKVLIENYYQLSHDLFSGAHPWGYFVGGVALADFSHVLLDHLSSFKKKYFS